MTLVLSNLPHHFWNSYTQEDNRGGLYSLYQLRHADFLSLWSYVATRTKLPTHLLKTATCALLAESTKEEDTTEIVKTICNDEDVLFYWTLAGVDLDEEGSY